MMQSRGNVGRRLLNTTRGRDSPGEFEDGVDSSFLLQGRLRTRPLFYLYTLDVMLYTFPYGRLYDKAGKI